MKEISEETDIASSVLSSLYSSVLPMYVNLLSSGTEPEAALDQALQQVNNVSKRKLLGCLDDLYEKVCHLEPRLISAKMENVLFWMILKRRLSDICRMQVFMPGCI